MSDTLVPNKRKESQPSSSCFLILGVGHLKPKNIRFMFCSLHRQKIKWSSLDRVMLTHYILFYCTDGSAGWNENEDDRQDFGL